MVIGIQSGSICRGRTELENESRQLNGNTSKTYRRHGECYIREVGRDGKGTDSEVHSSQLLVCGCLDGLLDCRQVHLTHEGLPHLLLGCGRIQIPGNTDCLREVCHERCG